MAYSWEEVKQAAERVEDASLEHELAQAEANEDGAVRRGYPLQRARPYLEVAGALILGVHVAIVTLITNYMVFVWLFHVNFSY